MVGMRREGVAKMTGNLAPNPFPSEKGNRMWEGAKGNNRGGRGGRGESGGTRFVNGGGG
jgi:hypothetical protein